MINSELFYKCCADVEQRGGHVTPRKYARSVLWLYLQRAQEVVRVKLTETEKDIIEKLAALAHEQWSGWMEYLFRFGTKNPDGTFTMDADKVTRWKRQMSTAYTDLPENEKASDRTEAKKALDCLQHSIDDSVLTDAEQDAVMPRAVSGEQTRRVVAQTVDGMDVEMIEFIPPQSASGGVSIIGPSVESTGTK